LDWAQVVLGGALLAAAGALLALAAASWPRYSQVSLGCGHWQDEPEQVVLAAGESGALLTCRRCGTGQRWVCPWL